MILESFYWKNELKELITNFIRYLSIRKKYTGSVTAKIETFFFVCCFIVRKINESNKLSDEISTISIPIIRYNSIQPFHSYLDRYEIPEHFDLNAGKKGNLNILDLLNMGIHSFCFFPFIKDGFSWRRAQISIYLNSDRTKNTYLYEVYLMDFIKILRKVEKDQIVSMSFIYDKTSREMKYTHKSSKRRIPVS